MLHPTQPARRACGLNAFLFSITLSEKKNRGTKSRLCTAHSEEYSSSNKFGAVSERIALSIVLYAESTILLAFDIFRLFNWNCCSHLGQRKSTAGLFVRDAESSSDMHAGQYSSREHQSSVTTRAICEPALYLDASSTRHCRFMSLRIGAL